MLDANDKYRTEMAEELGRLKQLAETLQYHVKHTNGMVNVNYVVDLINSMNAKYNNGEDDVS